MNVRQEPMKLNPGIMAIVLITGKYLTAAEHKKLFGISTSSNISMIL